MFALRRAVAASVRQQASSSSSVRANTLGAVAKAAPLAATANVEAAARTQVMGMKTHAASAEAPKDMFCFQCEQTRHAKACVPEKRQSVGVCGKTAQTAAMQDLLVHYSMGIAQYAHEARGAGLSDPEVDRFMLTSLFSTLTNVNFDPNFFVKYLKQAQDMRGRAKALYEKARAAGKGKDVSSGPAVLDLSGVQGDMAKLEALGHTLGVQNRRAVAVNEDVWSLGELVLYGLKGLAAYAEHAHMLGQEDDKVYAFIHEAMSALSDPHTGNGHQNEGALLALALKTGEVNFRVMEMLDHGHTSRFGHPTPTQVATSPVTGKCIAVSGHDLKDLEEVLKRTAGKGINVYTHGEMLPAHGYPGLKNKYPHLVGNYGGPWQMQKIEFGRFPGPIVVTTNCLVEPQRAYKDRLYTRSVVGFPGIKHLDTWDNFDQVIEQALSLPGFTSEDKQVKSPPTMTMTGFARNAVLGIADKVVDAVKSGDIKQFYLIGGCDGAEAKRTYFRDVATGLPDDSVVLTLGCGKYRFNKEPFGTTKGGIPRLLDVGQCNDAYSAIQIAVALANAFKTDVNSLPINYAISWFEQKAVAVFLTMLHLGIKNIRLGPALPAFVSPNVLSILVKNYGLKQVNLQDHQKDINEMLAGVKR